jgi:hypothetical protein
MQYTMTGTIFAATSTRALKRGRTIVELRPGRRKTADMLLAG